MAGDGVNSARTGEDGAGVDGCAGRLSGRVEVVAVVVVACRNGAGAGYGAGAGAIADGADATANDSVVSGFCGAVEGGDEKSCGGDDVGDGVFESLLWLPENWDINESTRKVEHVRVVVLA